MSDRATVALAAVVVLAARMALDVPLWPAVVVAVLACVVRSPSLLVVGAGWAASALAVAAWAGTAPPVAHDVDAVAELVEDPRYVEGALHVVARLEGRHVDAWVRGAAAWRLDDRLAGDQIHVIGRVGPVPEHQRDRLARHHIAARLEIDRVVSATVGAPPFRAANRLRSTLTDGSRALPDPLQALYLGFVLGDDRAQPPEVVDDFRGAGLTHLLAVSGQNVALVLTLIRPLQRRVGLGGRWVLAIGTIGWFAVLTRFEPSVLRAAAMAMIAATATLLGRWVTPIRTLALAVAVCVLVDPLLVWSLGFGLSVSASGAIALLGPRIEAALRGPAWLRAPLAVTLAAQIGTAWLLVPAFGDVPVASLPANLLAVPVAGFVTAYGLPAGILAGWLGGTAAEVLHLPTELAVGWCAYVARRCAWLPLGTLGAVHLALALAAVVVGSRATRSSVRAGAVVALLLVLVIVPAALDHARRPRGTIEYVLSSPPDEDVLGALRTAGIRHLDRLVLHDAGLADDIGPLLARVRVDEVVVAPAGDAGLAAGPG